MIPAAIALLTAAVIVGYRRAATTCASPAYCSSWITGAAEEGCIGAGMLVISRASAILPACASGGESSGRVAVAVAEGPCSMNLSITTDPRESEEVMGCHLWAVESWLCKLILPEPPFRVPFTCGAGTGSPTLFDSDVFVLYNNFLCVSYCSYLSKLICASSLLKKHYV